MTYLWLRLVRSTWFHGTTYDMRRSWYNQLRTHLLSWLLLRCTNETQDPLTALITNLYCSRLKCLRANDGQSIFIHVSYDVLITHDLFVIRNALDAMSETSPTLLRPSTQCTSHGTYDTDLKLRLPTMNSWYDVLLILTMRSWHEALTKICTHDTRDVVISRHTYEYMHSWHSQCGHVWHEVLSNTCTHGACNAFMTQSTR